MTGGFRVWAREHGLLLANLSLFVVFFAGMAATGLQVHNAQELLHHGTAISFWQYVTTGDFVEATFENWESEFLQMGMFVVLTVFLFQKGSSQSKPPTEKTAQDDDPRHAEHRAGLPRPVLRGGVLLVLYENSLAIMFFAFFVAAFALHAVGGAAAYSAEQVAHGAEGLTAWQYVLTAKFWFESFQNRQSEFMVVALMIGASIFLRQRGSAESKPVATPNSETSS